MAFWKQAALAAFLVVAAVAIFARLYPGAGDVLSRAGVPPAVVALLAGKAGDVGPASDGSAGGAAGRGGGFGGGRPTLVEMAPVRIGRINDRINAIGDGEALRSVAVVPLADGILVDVSVSAGSRVEKDQVLARLDSQSETLARDRAALTLQTAEEKLARTERLASSRAATEVAVNDARAEVEAARLALREAQLALDRRAITAPIAGFVGIVPVETGRYVTTTTEIATIDDRSQLLVDFWVPERFAAMVKPGQEVKATPLALPGSAYAGTIDAVGSRIDRESRTFQIRARLPNPEDILRPGMSFRVEMAFPGEDFPSVDPLAIQWSSDGAFVWKARDGKALRTSVRIVQRNSDSVLVDGDLVTGEEVVTEGVQTLREGTPLRVAGAGEAEQPMGGSRRGAAAPGG